MERLRIGYPPQTVTTAGSPGDCWMKCHEVIEDQREHRIEQALRKMNVRRRQLSREELEAEIIDYLSIKQPCSLATCGSDGAPRISVVDYINEGLVIYIFSEGGDKFKNLRNNKQVAIGIGTGTKAINTRGINIWGTAEVFSDDTPEFMHGITVFKPILKDMEDALGVPVHIPKGLLKMIRVTPVKIVYHRTCKGIKYALWEAS